ncbi:hypothetical protein SLEP1_g46196 [Rubroshorea leprosula]|uniref:Uncharacterized protein n=1 Tax=Rubroshorea leprosula TaxID=152421 RepID=A0AAV5LLG8_9ROSI|nr:hypothetical protein SLEP1_g46196 [Rubroshorea leprosula]
MRSEAPNWADQWGAGGVGALVEDDNTTNQKDGGRNKKGGKKDWFGKAKEVALKEASESMIKMAKEKVIKFFSKIFKKKKSPSE